MTGAQGVVGGTQGAAPDAQVRNAAVLSFGHAAVMVLGGVLALLIAHFFGKSAETDAFFAAYGVYAIALVFIGGRFVLGITGWETLGIEIVQAIIWGCLALAVPLADISLNWRELRNVSVPAKPAIPQSVPERIVRAA